MLEIPVEPVRENPEPATHAQLGRLNLLGLIPTALNIQMGIREPASELIIDKGVANELLSLAKDAGLW